MRRHRQRRANRGNARWRRLKSRIRKICGWYVVSGPKGIVVNARLACGPDSESNKAVCTNVASILLRSIFKIVRLADAKQATGVDNCIKTSGCCCQGGGMQMFCMSCFMTMIDYYLLGARVSFCVCKNSCHVVQKLPCCLSGSSLSSDIATQVTCIVIAQCSSKFSSSDVVTCFLLSGGLVFLFSFIFTTLYRGFIACGRSNVRSGARCFEPAKNRLREEG